MKKRKIPWKADGYHLNEAIDLSSPDDYYCFVNTFKYDKEKTTLDKYTIIEESRKRIVYNWLQYFSRDSLRREFEENGLRVTQLYSDVAGKTLVSESTEIAIVANKCLKKQTHKRI